MNAKNSKSAKPLRATAEHTPDALVQIDAKGRIQFATPAIEATLGYAPDELRGESFTSLLSGDLAERHLEAVDRYLTTGTRTLDWGGIEWPGRHKDGHELPLNISFIEFTLDSDRHLMGVVRDISTRQALENERDLISDILRTTPTGIVVLDIDGRFSYANEYAEDLLRIAPDEEGRYPSLDSTPFQLLDDEGEALSESEQPHRTVLREGEGVARDVGVEFSNGERRWVAVYGTPLRDSEGDVTRAVVAFEDVTDRKRQIDRLDRLNRLERELSGVESFDTACELAVTAARDMLDLPLSTLERYIAEKGDLEPCERTPQLETLLGEEPLFAADRGLPWQAFAWNREYLIDDLEGYTGVDSDGTPFSSVAILPIEEHGVFITGATEPNAFSEADIQLAENLVQKVKTAFDRLDREESLHERKAELETKDEQLQRLQRVNREIRGVTRAVRDATSIAEIKQLACDQLAESGPYRFAWFGEHDVASDDINPTASAGVEEGYLDAVEITADTSETGQGPGGRAIRTCETQIQNDLYTDPPFEPWRQEAIQRGYRASIAVPVVYDGVFYGLLNLYAGEPNVFTAMEATVLSELGETVGYAINAMEQRNALVSENSVELEFRIREFSSPLLSVLGEREGRVRLESIGPREEGSLRVFIACRDIDFDTVEPLFASHFDDTDFTLIRDRDNETIVELELSSEEFLVTLIEQGAVPIDLRATPKEARITVRVPRSGSVRKYIGLFEQRYGDSVELVAQRNSSDPVQTRVDFERAYASRLTDRQQEVLQTAYFAGFFEQPRGSSARDVAEMLNVSQPTVSRHLRNGQRKLFSLLFGDREDR